MCVELFLELQPSDLSCLERDPKACGGSGRRFGRGAVKEEVRQPSSPVHSMIDECPRAELGKMQEFHEEDVFAMI